MASETAVYGSDSGLMEVEAGAYTRPTFGPM